MNDGAIQLILDVFAQRKVGMLFVKTDKGYSAVLIKPSVYREHFSKKDHFLGPTALAAAHRALISMWAFEENLK